MKSLKKNEITKFLAILEHFLKLLSSSEPLVKRGVIFGIFFVSITILLNILSPFLLKELVGGFSLSLAESRNLLLLLGISYALAWGTTTILG